MKRCMKCWMLAAVVCHSLVAYAQESKPSWTFAFHGFLGGSLFAQDQFLGVSAGAQSFFAGPPQLTTDRLALGGDVRQNRLNFSITGPKALGGTPKGVVEMDFFGGNGAGAYGDVSVFPRLRLVWAELGWEDTTLRVGQDWSLTLGFNTLGLAALGFPTSVGHIANPIGYAAGSLGWRFPGIFVYHRIPLGDMKLELALEVARAAWANPTPATVSGTGTIAPAFFTTNLDLGSASALPQVEARALLMVDKSFAAFVGGHWSQVDPQGWGMPPRGTNCTTTDISGCDKRTVYAGNAGLRYTWGPLTVQGTGYVGQNNSPEFGEIVQFGNLGAGDVFEWGAWGQAGFNITKELSIWGFLGSEQPSYDSALRAFGPAARLGNVVSQGMLRYAEAGFTFGLEVTHWHTRYPTTSIDGNQVMFSTFYFF